MKRARDKRGLDIEVGDTLVGGDYRLGASVTFIEVDAINEDGVVFGHDLDDETYVLQRPAQYVSICACYRDARAQVAREQNA